MCVCSKSVRQHRSIPFPFHSIHLSSWGTGCTKNNKYVPDEPDTEIHHRTRVLGPHSPIRVPGRKDAAVADVDQEVREVAQCEEQAQAGGPPLPFLPDPDHVVNVEGAVDSDERGQGDGLWPAWHRVVRNIEKECKYQSNMYSHATQKQQW